MTRLCTRRTVGTTPIGGTEPAGANRLAVDRCLRLPVAPLVPPRPQDGAAVRAQTVRDSPIREAPLRCGPCVVPWSASRSPRVEPPSNEAYAAFHPAPNDHRPARRFRSSRCLGAAAAHRQPGIGRHVERTSRPYHHHVQAGDRRQEAAGCGGDGRAQGQAGLCAGLRRAQRRGLDADGARHDVPHLLDDQADGVDGADDAGRGRQGAADRPGVEVPAVVQEPDGQRRPASTRCSAP